MSHCSEWYKRIRKIETIFIKMTTIYLIFIWIWFVISKSEFAEFSRFYNELHTYTDNMMTQLLTPLMLCVLIVYMRGGVYSCIQSATDFWETLSWQFYLLSEFLPVIWLEAVVEETFLSYFDFFEVAWPGFWNLTKSLISQHTTC